MKRQLVAVAGLIIAGVTAPTIRGTASTIAAFIMAALAAPALLCALALSPLVPTIAAGGALALSTVTAVSVVLQLRKTRRIVAGLPTNVSTVSADYLRTIEERLDLLEPLRLVDSEEAFAFTHGLLRPRIVLSRALVEELAEDEVEAVVRHELAHLRRRDPLRVLLARALSVSFCFLPFVRPSVETYLCRIEVAADRSAVVEMGDVVPLASALRRLLVAGNPTNLAAAAISALSPNDVRIDHLLGLSTPPIQAASTMNRVQVAVLLLGLGALSCLSMGSTGWLTAVDFCMGC